MVSTTELFENKELWELPKPPEYTETEKLFYISQEFIFPTFKITDPKASKIFSLKPIDPHAIMDIINCPGCFQDHMTLDKKEREIKKNPQDIQAVQQPLVPYSQVDIDLQKPIQPTGLERRDLEAKKTGRALHSFIAFMHSVDLVKKAGFDQERITTDPSYIADILSNEWTNFYNSVNPENQKSYNASLAIHIKELESQGVLESKIIDPLIRYVEAQQSFGTSPIDAEIKYGLRLYSTSNKYKLGERVFSYIPLNGTIDQIRLSENKVQVIELKKDIFKPGIKHALQLASYLFPYQIYAKQKKIEKITKEDDKKKDNELYPLDEARPKAQLKRIGYNFFLPELILYNMTNGEQNQLVINKPNRFINYLVNMSFYAYILKRGFYHEYSPEHHPDGIPNTLINPNKVQIGINEYSLDDIYGELKRITAEFEKTYEFKLREEGKIIDEEETETITAIIENRKRVKEIDLDSLPLSRIIVPGKRERRKEIASLQQQIKETRYEWKPYLPEGDVQEFRKIPMVQKKILDRMGIPPEERSVFLNPEGIVPTIEGVGISRKEVEKAKQRIYSAITNGEEIIVFGDYDPDGISATVITAEVIKGMGGKVTPIIPTREKGYGLTVQEVDTFYDETKLIITVDNGVNVHDAIIHAGWRGMDVISLDHHKLPEKPAHPLALVHTRQLSSAGIAYLFANELTQLNDFDKKRFLELVAPAHIADQVPVPYTHKEARALVKQSLKQLNNPVSYGMRQLLTIARIRKTTIEDDFDLFKVQGGNEIAYQVNPLINAAGRIHNAELPYQLLTTRDPIEAAFIAEDLYTLNKNKNVLITKALQDIRRKVVSNISPEDRALVVANEEPRSWPIGITEQIARRLVSTYKIPAAVLIADGDYYRGAIRSIRGLSANKLLGYVQAYVEDSSGGITSGDFLLHRSRLGHFQYRLNSAAQELITPEMLTPPIEYDVLLSPSFITDELIEAINEAGPFLGEYREPVFRTNGLIAKVTGYAGDHNQHIKQAVEKKGTRRVNSIALYQKDRILEVYKEANSSEPKLDFLYNVAHDNELTDYQGKGKMIVISAKPSNELEVRKKDKEKAPSAIRIWGNQLKDASA